MYTATHNVDNWQATNHFVSVYVKWDPCRYFTITFRWQTRMVGLPGDKSLRIYVTHFDTIRERDRKTDGWKHGHHTTV